MGNFTDRFGAAYATPKGFVFEPGDAAPFCHRFGGNSWKVVGSSSAEDSPALLFVLDLRDRRLSGLSINSVDELPICSFINSDLWLDEQVYRICCQKREVVLVGESLRRPAVVGSDLRISIPVPERPLHLRDMEPSEYPIDEDAYWRNTNEFLGGGSVFRVAGSPLWLQDPVSVRCSCGRNMQYVMCMGYEAWDGPYAFIDGAPFFLGEAALYVYFCDHCLELRVISQSS